MINKILRHRMFGFLRYIYRKCRIEYNYIRDYKSISSVMDELIKPCINLFLFLTPSHDNLGDHAIVYAEKLLIADNLPEYNIVEILLGNTYSYSKYIKKFIKTDDIIALHGGGNIGDQYLFEEASRRYLIKSFANNRIVSFPQTIYFSNSNKGNKELEKTKHIYSKHMNLIIAAREKTSYDMMKTIFPKNKIILTPDMVLYSGGIQSVLTGKDILVCIRNDKEGLLDSSQKTQLIKQLESRYTCVCISDTAVNRDVYPEQRETELQDLLAQFQNARVVITDRLHGMIFAILTGTPCVTLRNYNHKITAEYEWIKDLEHIRLISNYDVDEVLSLVEKLYSMDKSNIVIPDLKAEFQPLMNELREI